MNARWEALKERAEALEREAYALYLAYRDPRTPWYAKVWTALVVAYAFSPIDLIPDFIPVLGYLDDLLIVPAGIALALKLIPAEVWRECRARAQREHEEGEPKSRAGALIVIGLWLLAIGLVATVVWRIARLG